ncbi:MAG: ligand-binding sensor domain-containing protein, partial [Bacteroidia bacterium]
FTEKEGLSNNLVFSMLEDKSGNLWFGTSGGVSKYDGKSFTHFTEKEGLSNNLVFSILEDKSGNLWFGTSGGVSKYDGKSFTHFTEKEGLSSNNVRSILEDKSGNLWFGTYDGVSKYDGKSFTHFTEKEGLSNNTVWSMLEDKSGNLWFGTSGGVSKYDGNRVEAIEAALQRGETIPERTRQDIKKINGKFVKSITHFTEKEGLSNNTVLSMLEDKSGNLWFGSRFGLSKLSPENKEKLVALSGVEGSDTQNPSEVAKGKVFFKNYTYEDGFLGIGVNGGKTICEDKNGTIWVAANDRLTAYHPEGEIADTVAPNIQLTSIVLFNENIAWANLQKSKIQSQNSKETNVASDTSFTLENGVSVGNFEFDGITKWYGLPENLSLAYNNNYLTFNFIGITQKQSKKVKYQYKLEGIDENWSALTNRTEGPYGNLPQGNYTFKVKAMNSEGYWSNEFNYTFTIRPPWWKTWWFRIFVGLIIICSVWYYIKSREKKLVAEKEILERTVEERTEELVQKNIVVEKQKHLVEEKQKEIIDSINYAKRIQQSQLPTEKYIDKSIKRLKKD